MSRWAQWAAPATPMVGSAKQARTAQRGGNLSRISLRRLVRQILGTKRYDGSSYISCRVSSAAIIAREGRSARSGDSSSSSSSSARGLRGLGNGRGSSKQRQHTLPSPRESLPRRSRQRRSTTLARHLSALCCYAVRAARALICTCPRGLDVDQCGRLLRATCARPWIPKSRRREPGARCESHPRFRSLAARVPERERARESERQWQAGRQGEIESATRMRMRPSQVTRRQARAC